MALARINTKYYLFRLTSFLRPKNVCLYTTFSRPGPVPLGNPEEQKEFEELVRKKNQGSLSTNEELQVHPDLRDKPPSQFEGDKNPLTGEIGGPKQDPLRHGDWSYGSR
ncbi:10395_t:CDS:1, partial [Acaulospora morrowiae]